MKESATERTQVLRSGLTAVLSALVAAFAFVGLVNRVLEPPSEYVVQVGINAFRMFTVLSNLLMAFCALMVIPYGVDGIRERRFRMPRWIICMLYVSATSVAVTFSIAIAVLSPVAGYGYMMLQGSRLFLHTLAPLLAIVLFMFVTTPHHLGKRWIIRALIPELLYAAVYVIEVFIIGEANGGWADHYRFGVYLPWPLTLIGLTILCAGIAAGLRLAHNRMHACAEETAGE